jgi:hypothetical protein
VDGLDEAKEVWTTLRMAHEGSKPMRKAKIDMLEGQLNRFAMFDDETPQDMFNRLKKLANKAKVLGSKKWTNHMLTEYMMRAYTPMNYNVVALIHQDPIYKRMSSNDVLGRIMNHEMYVKEANHINNLSKGITTTRKQEIALKANKKSKNKQMVVESSSEEEDSSECDAEDMALFMKKFKKYIKKKKFSKGDKKFKSTTKRTCYNYSKHGHSLLIVALSVGMMMMTRRSASPTRRRRATRGVTGPTRSPMVKLTLVKNESSMMKAPTPIVMVWQPLLSREHLFQASLSSQSSIKGRTHASWWRVSIR